MKELTPEEIREITLRGRAFLKQDASDEPEGYKSDQQKMLPQPPLVKAPVSDVLIDLPMDFKPLGLEKNLMNVIFNRCSSRVYTDEPLTLLELSFLLWATQGIKGIRGRRYATLRTVPCGGARHPFETYLLVRKVEGLEPGRYHYLPMTNQLEYLGAVENIESVLNESLCDQRWAMKSSVVFYWSFVPYRTEWRYGIFSHRGSLIDMGHVGENLYLACSATNLGTCGIGAYAQNLCDELFGLDGEDEYIIYTETVGTIRAEDKDAEKDFYKFVEEAGW
ncbi:MAG: SagB/ThcOx family dehydrogenase [Ruminococcus bromii]|nr:SagB/ThcOx family dehydrogenase [Ruminococcus bromii]